MNPTQPSGQHNGHRAPKDAATADEKTTNRIRVAMKRIYTRNGDRGTTSLGNGRIISKADPNVAAIGNLDELDAHIAHVHDLLQHNPLVNEHCPMLKRICRHLWRIRAVVALAPVPIDPNELEAIETETDGLSANLPDLRHFILMYGHSTVSMIHIARTVCRRAECSVVALKDGQDDVDPAFEAGRIIEYLNRLSSYLFVLARSVGDRLAVPEAYLVD